MTSATTHVLVLNHDHLLEPRLCPPPPPSPIDEPSPQPPPIRPPSQVTWDAFLQWRDLEFLELLRPPCSTGEAAGMLNALGARPEGVVREVAGVALAGRAVEGAVEWPVKAPEGAGESFFFFFFGRSRFFGGVLFLGCTFFFFFFLLLCGQ